MRNSKENIEIRREKVKLMLSMHYPVYEIASEVGASRRTITNDIKYIRTEWKEQFEKMTVHDLVMEMKHEWESRKRILRVELKSAKTEQYKASIIKSLREENKQMQDFLQSIGKLPKKAMEIKADLSFNFDEEITGESDEN